MQFGIMSFVCLGIRAIKVELEYLVFLQTRKRKNNGEKAYPTI